MSQADAPRPAAPASITELLGRLDASIDTLPRRMKQCATFTRRHLHLIAVSTVAEMAKASGVAPSVYVRFCQAMGFSGYSGMQALLRIQFTEFRPDYDARLAALTVDPGGISRLLAEFAESGHRSILSLANSVTKDSLGTVARGLAEARVVHLIGVRRAFAVASSMTYLFSKMGVGSMLHGGAGMLDGSAAIQKGDAVFAITYAPFSSETVEFASLAARRGVAVFGLSDRAECPLSELTTTLLIAREDEVGSMRALNASITLTTTLAVAVGALRERS